jgi:hypothetical protein
LPSDLSCQHNITCPSLLSIWILLRTLDSSMYRDYSA